MSAVHVAPDAAAPGASAPALMGMSLLEVLGAPLEYAGRERMFAYSPAALLQGKADGRIVCAPAAAAEAGPEVERHTVPLGRQRVLWEAIPGLRGELDAKKHIKAAAVGVVVDATGAVLITRRAATMRSYPGCWVLAGGAVDAGESLPAAALREIEEETGLSLEVSGPLTPIAMWESAFPLTVEGYTAAGCLKAHMLMVAYAVKLDVVAPTLKLSPAEVDVSVWLPQQALRELLDFSLTATHPPAAVHPVEGAPPPPCAEVAPAQLMGVYPNPQNEGLGLAHHFVLGQWLKEGCQATPAKLKPAAAA